MKKIFLCIVFIHLVALIGCSGSDEDDDYNVMYEVSSDEAERANITYTNEQGNTVHLSDIDISGAHWTYSFTAESGHLLSLSAQIIDAEGSIRVTIYVYGEEFSSQLSWGQNVSAATSGTL